MEKSKRESRIALFINEYLSEIIAFSMLAVVFILSTLNNPELFTIDYLFTQFSFYFELGIIAIALTIIIISGNLDLSVASMLVMTICIVGWTHVALGIPMSISILIGMLVGIIAGAINGYLISYIKLPSLVVTLGTLSLYRGVAEILLGDHSLQGFPEWFVGIDKIVIQGTQIKIIFIIYLVLIILTALLLQKTIFGRYIFALGVNEQAARYSGVPTRKVKFLIFVISGLLCSLGGILLLSRLGVARYDLASGWELQAITVVVLGGTLISGGRGTAQGTLIALMLVIFLRTGMGIANIKIESQMTIVGFLLIFSVVLYQFIEKYRSERRKPVDKVQ